MAKKMIQISKKTDDILVTTWDGREIPLEKCKRIGKTNPQYYEINVDCFYVLHPSGYRWTRLNTGKIAYSHESKKYELITTLQNNNELVNGIIDTNENKGYFKFNPYTTVVLVDNHQESPENGILCLNKELANDLGYHEYFGSGLYVKEKDKKRIMALGKIQLYKYKGVNKLNYNADNNNKMFLNIIKEYQQNKKFINISPNTEQAAKLLPYSFGIEYETSNGFIPKQSLSLLGVVPLKDGSLRKENGEEPYEYTTIPLEGAYGLETIKMLSNELNKRCEFDHKCSLHIHLGNLKKRTPEFVIAFYKLCYNLQDEIFSMFPAYKNHPEKYVAHFHKNYCQKLPDLNLDQFNFSTIKSPKDAKLMTKEAFDLIYRYMCDGVVSVTDDYYNLNNTVHPKGDIDKWNYSARYHFVNLVPYLFSNKKTIEFRLHGPTFSHTKVSNWLFISAALIQCAEQFTNEILKNEIPYKLSHVLSCYSNNFFKSFYESEFNTSVSKYLIDYVEHRKTEMNKSFDMQDWYGDRTIEFSKDKNYKFESTGLNSIY